MRPPLGLRGWIASACCVLGAACAPLRPGEPSDAQLEVVRPSERAFSGPPAIPELRGAWLIGAEQAAGPYALRVRLAGGGRIPPHTHPDARHTVVLEGTLYVGVGPRFDSERLLAVPAGAVYLAPAGVPHFVWARDGDVEYQENGVGPTATRFVEQPGSRIESDASETRVDVGD